MLYSLIAFGLIVITILVALLIIQIPIVVARSRGIYGSDLTTITILSWLGIFFGLTWIVALVLSLVWGPSGTDRAVKNSAIDPSGMGWHTLDRLEQLQRLKKEGAITQKEFNAEKKKILGK